MKSFDGEDYILERGIRADLSIIKGWKADEAGNLMFRKTARNFNQPMATAGRICVAEVEDDAVGKRADPLRGALDLRHPRQEREHAAAVEQHGRC